MKFHNGKLPWTHGVAQGAREFRKDGDYWTPASGRKLRRAVAALVRKELKRARQ